MTLERERWTSVVRPDLALWIEHVLQDVRSGTRVLWTAPAVSLTAVALVALVVGGNTTIYSVVRMMLTNPAAGVTADGLVTVAALRPTSGEPFVSYPDYLDLASADVVERSAAWTTERLTVNVEGVPHAVSAGLVTGAYFDVLAVTAREGRVLTPRDEGPGAEGLVAVVSERWSRDRFGSDRSVVGRRLLVNGQPVTVVGVAAKRFRGALLTPGEDLWMPLVPFHQARHSEGTLGARAEPLLTIIGRLPSGRSIAAAQTRATALAARLAKRFPGSHGDLRLNVSGYSATALLPIARMSGPFLALLAVIVAVTLLVVSANVANLMLVRALARQREMAVRLSLGATRGRLMRLVVIEGLAIALAAWLLAVAVASVMSRGLIRTIGPGPGGAMDDFAPDWTLVLYALLLAMLATVAFTLMPALRSWQQPVLPWLKSGEQAIAGGHSLVMRTLVVAQIAFAVLLLASAGLAYRSLGLLDTRSVGFDANGVLAVTVRLGAPDAATDRAMATNDRSRSLAPSSWRESNSAWTDGSMP